MISKSQVKYIQSLGQKKQRDEEEMFIVEGAKLVRELLRSANVKIFQIYAVGEWIDTQKNHAPIEQVIEISEDELAKISLLKSPNQVVAIVKKFSWPVVNPSGKLALVLDAIRDPGNLGTIVRIADWFGVSQIVCSNDCADIYNPKVVQATMGSIARINVMYSDLDEWLPQQPVRVYGSVLEGKDIRRMKPVQEGLIVIGNESRGIGSAILPYVNERITIPGKGGAESLNAAVAAGIILSYLT